MNKISILVVLVAVVVVLWFFSAKAEGTPGEAWSKIEAGALVIDVRSAEEFASGHLDGAMNIVHTDTDALVKAVGDDKSRSVVLYCRSGRRSGIALKDLQERGYTNVINGGGFAALRDAKPSAP